EVGKVGKWHMRRESPRTRAPNNLQLACTAHERATARVAELGSVFEDESDDPRGPDLRVTVEVPRAALGASIRVPVPRRLAHEGDLVERAVLDHGDPDRVALHLPEELAPRTMLRLRGQGGVHPSGRAGDLQIVVELVDRSPRD